MKVNKNFCIDDKLIVDLSKCNASLLVNDLLIDHFDGKNSVNLSKLKHKLYENRQKKKKLCKEIRDLRVKIAKIEEKEIKILKISKKYSDYLLKSIDGCENINNFYLSWRGDEGLKRYPWLEVKKLFNYLKGGGRK